MITNKSNLIVSFLTHFYLILGTLSHELYSVDIFKGQKEVWDTIISVLN